MSKNFIITGGSNGIGRAVANILLNNGYFVTNLDIVKPQQLHNNETFIQIDLSNHKLIYNTVSELNNNFSGIFLNVGKHISGNIFTQEIEDIYSLFNLNIISNITVVKALENKLLPNCSIVWNGSDQCTVGKTNNFAYGLTKGAIGQITKSMALDLASKNIRVNAVCSGTVETDIYTSWANTEAKKLNCSRKDIDAEESKDFPMKRIAKPNEIAEVVCFLLSEKSSFMTGALVPVDAGYTAK